MRTEQNKFISELKRKNNTILKQNKHNYKSINISKDTIKFYNFFIFKLTNFFCSESIEFLIGMFGRPLSRKDRHHRLTQRHPRILSILKNIH